MAFNSGKSQLSTQDILGQNISAAGGLEKLVFPEDLHSFPDDDTPAVHPDFIRIGIHHKPGASLDGLKDYAEKTVGTARAKVLSDIKSGKNVAKVLNQIDEITSKEKPDKAKLAELNKQLIQANNEQIALQGKDLANFNNVVGSEKKQIVDSLGTRTAGEVVGEGLSKTVDLVTGAFNASVAGNDAASRNAETPLAGIYLPMPDNLTFAEPVEWQGTELGALSLIRDKIFEEGGPGASALVSGGLGQIGAIVGGGAGSLVSSLFGGGVVGGALIGALGAGNQIQGAIESTFRIKSNPFKEQTFGGVPFRPFEFSWTLAPQNYQESLTLDKIIRLIRGHSKPTFADADKTLFNYPNEFTIHFFTLDEFGNPQENSYLPKLKNLVCKSVNTNFTAAGWRSFKDGAPTSVTLQVSFEEIDIVTRDEVLDSGGY